MFAYAYAPIKSCLSLCYIDNVSNRAQVSTILCVFGSQTHRTHVACIKVLARSKIDNLDLFYEER